MSEASVRKAFEAQAGWCERLGSPLTAAVCRAFEACLDRTTEAGRTVLDWAGDPSALGDSVPLRIAGALHDLARSGTRPDLSALYPPHALLPDKVMASTLRRLLPDLDADILPWLASPPQTNEVARAGVLYPGLMEVAHQTGGMPIALYEIGTSAGLNLRLDHFSYDLGGVKRGLPSSRVVITPAWSGYMAAGPEPVIVGRRGCDLKPIDPLSVSGRRRLFGYTWPDQSLRLERLAGAISIASEVEAQVDCADAGDWVERHFAQPGQTGVTRVLMHSIALQYMPAVVQARISAAVEHAGRLAHERAPVAWLSFEQFDNAGPRLTLRLWPGGNTRVLTTKADAHVRNVNWSG
jgi:hypothetical protein